MTDTRTVMACLDCGLHWDAQHDAARCTDPSHEQQTFEVHRHRDEVVFPGGTVVLAVSLDPPDPYQRPVVPDYGLYLDPGWQPPWTHDHLAWPDFGVPDHEELRRTLRRLLGRAEAGQRVEIGCLGGHGRTGTALACLAVLTGCPSEGATAWVRSHYCPQAVEGPAQEEFVRGFDA